MTLMKQAKEYGHSLNMTDRTEGHGGMSKNCEFTNKILLTT
jgi:hypothetical protein